MTDHPDTTPIMSSGEGVTINNENFVELRDKMLRPDKEYELFDEEFPYGLFPVETMDADPKHDHRPRIKAYIKEFFIPRSRIVEELKLDEPYEGEQATVTYARHYINETKKSIARRLGLEI